MSTMHTKRTPHDADRKAVLPEELARRVAGETLADFRTVRRELASPGTVRGLVGARIREAIARHARTGRRAA